MDSNAYRHVLRHIRKILRLLLIHAFQQILEVKNDVVKVCSKLLPKKIALRFRWLLALLCCNKVVTQLSDHLFLILGGYISILVYVGFVGLTRAPVPFTTVEFIDGL